MKITGKLETQVWVDKRAPDELRNVPPGIYETSLGDRNSRLTWLVYNGYVYSFEDGILSNHVYPQRYQTRMVVPMTGVKLTLEFQT